MNTTILEDAENGEVPVDVYQKLCDDRILFIHNYIDDAVASDIAATLLLKNAEDPTKKISLFLNSMGGDVRNILMICDVMDMIEAPVETVCIGEVMDESVAILVSGTPGMRYATKNSVISVSQLIHKWMSMGNLTDAKKYLDLATLDNKRVMQILAKTCGKPITQVMKDFDRRAYMSAPQAVKYGLIDKVIKLGKRT